MEVWAGGRRGARLARPTRKHTCSTVQSGKAVTRYRVPLQKNAWGERGSARARGRARAPPPLPLPTMWPMSLRGGTVGMP